MWSPLLLCLLVGIASANNNLAWKRGQEYTYQVRGRTLAGLHQVADQYTGIAIKALLKCQAKGDDVLSCKIQHDQVADIHAQLPGGWDSPLPENKVHYEDAGFGGKQFEIKFKNGAIKDLVVEKSLPTWQVNIIKSIASQLQVDTQGQNVMKSRHNQEPENNNAYGSYKTMEDTVTGKCEVLYDISPLPDYVLQTKPELAPIPNLKGAGQIIDIVKTQNFSNCDQRMGYHHGISGSTDWEAGSNSMGDFLAKSSVSRVVISGRLDEYTIQSSVTTNKIAVSPTLENSQKGMVVSRLNVTLESVNPADGNPKSPSNPESAGSLVYSYNSPFEANTKRRQSRSDDNSESDDSSSGSSSSSSSSSEEYDNQYKAGRRFPRSANADSDSSSSSSSSESDSLSSSEEYWQPTPTLAFAPETPMLPLFIGFEGSATQQSNKVNPVAIAKKLSNQIGAELQKPSSIPSQDTLEKFSNLAALLRTMSQKQIEQAFNEIYEPSCRFSGNDNSQSQSMKCAAWNAFRDAVAQAGTGPAFVSIQNWISTKKVKGSEAAELLAVLPNTCQYPTQEYMNAFFELATSSEVMKQANLNSTAILAFAELARKSQVDEDSAHNSYPVHSFGRLSPKKNPAVTKQWIPYIAKQLKNAIREADSPKIQVYIRALGEIGHPDMLVVFEPYLEGKEEASTFQRLMMVLSMDRLTKLHPKHARAVLYKIYQNTGEAFEVRTAAVYQLMRTNPPASMLQRMAEFTNQDTNKQVNSAVKSAIESAAECDDSELSQNARSATPLLNNENMSLQYSRDLLRGYSAEQMNAAYRSSASWIGSEDSIVPQVAYAVLHRNKGGLDMPVSRYGAAVSSVDDLLDALYDQFEDDDNNDSYSNSRNKNKKHQQTNNRNSSPFSPENILNALNIQNNDQEQLEGNILFSYLQWERFIAFDNNTIEQLPRFVKQAAAGLKHGQQFNYTKLYAGNELTVSFPTAMGLPFVYSMRTPSLVQYGGDVQADAQPRFDGSDDEISIPDSIKINANMHAVYSQKMIARIGFVNPASHQHHIAGLDKNFQVNLPFSAEVSVDIENSHVRAKLQPFDNEQSYNLVHFSSWPYTAQMDVLNEKPASQQKGHYLINVRDTQKNEWTFGQKSTGFAFRLQAECQDDPQESTWSKVAKMLQSNDALSLIAFFGDEESIQHSNYNLVLDAQHSSNKAVVLTASYFNLTKGMNGDFDSESEWGYKHPASRRSGNKNDDYDNDDENDYDDHDVEAPQPTSGEPDSERRQKQFLKKAAAGIKDAYAQVVDIGAEFQGKNKAQFAATIAMASSSVADQSRVLVYAGASPAQGKSYQFNLAAQGSSPRVPVMDFVKALKADPTSKFEADITFGEKGQAGARVQIRGKLAQSDERKQYLRRSPMAHQCAEEMEQGNKALPACRNVTARANLFDEGKLTVKYDQVPAYLRNISAQAYGFVRYLTYHNAYENTIDPENQKDGQIDFEYEVSPDFEHLNVTMNAPALDANITNLEITGWARPFVAVDPVQSAARRFGRQALAGQYNPTCVIDNNEASTFDNKTYPIELGNCWHVVMTAIPDDDDDSNDWDQDIPDNMQVSVVGRDVNGNEREYKLYFGETEIQMSPNGGKPAAIKVNGRQVELSETQIHRHSEDGQVQFEAYRLPGGSAVIYSEAYGIKAIYDGSRIALVLKNKYRNQIRGLCGTFDGEPATDFTAPKNCILRQPEVFTASYAMTKQDQCEGPAMKNSRKVSEARCYPQTIVHGNVVTDRQAGRKQQNQQRSGSSSASNTCTKYRTIVTEENNQICFSLRPYPTCAPGCHATKNHKQTVGMHCIQNSNQAQSMAQRVRQGANPDLRQKANNKNARISVPSSCAPGDNLQ